MDVTILFVTPDKNQVTQLSELLGHSFYIKRVEWIDSDQPYEDRVKRQLFDRGPKQAFIVIFDYNVCGPRAWTFISSIHDLMPHGNFEWVICRHTGLVPFKLGIPWHRVTFLDEALA